jgi:hypothetical protein
MDRFKNVYKILSKFRIEITVYGMTDVRQLTIMAHEDTEGRGIEA